MASATPERADALSVPEMLRIMDVATTLRQDRELIEEQLNVDELKKRLRDRMIAAAKVTGEEVTPEEVDAAIGQYYSRLYQYEEPKWNLEVGLAHLYVRRIDIAKRAAVLLGSLLLVWWLFLSQNGPFTLTGRTHKQVERLAAEAARRGEAIRAVAKDPTVAPEVARLTAEADTFRKQADPAKLQAVTASLADLEKRLDDAYTVSIVANPNNPKKNAVDRMTKVEGKHVRGYYVFLQARRPDGSVVKRKIHSVETGRDKEVEVWGEQLPLEVYERLKHDKQADGVLNETTFAVKKRGYAEEQVTMPGADGKEPLTRLGQITEW